MKNNIIAGAGPFYFNGNNIGVLMFHGFGGGTCSDLKYIAEEIFNRRGYTLHLPLLPGFGTTPEHLSQVQLKDWKESIKNSFEVIQKMCEVVIVGGHSIGGVLPFLLAESYKIDGIFTISAPIGIRGLGPVIAPIIRLFMKYHKIESEQFRHDTNGKWVGYDKIPINIVSKIKKLIAQMKDSLPNITCPVLLIQGRNDKQIKKKSMDYIYNNITSTYKNKIWLEKNDHPILNSPDQDIIIKELMSFIERIAIKNEKLS